MDFALTDEQQDFSAAIADFCARECGTQEQRERLTDGYKDHHNFDLYKQMAELGWLGVTICSSPAPHSASAPRSRSGRSSAASPPARSRRSR